jgi:predicted PhzF superfamily epimerase YddE/YHI9
VTQLHVLRVFVGPAGRGGNPLGVFIDGTAVEAADRQAVAIALGFSETVFVDDISDDTATIRIFTPGRELSFAGHPTVGTSWLLATVAQPVATLCVPAGDVATWQDGQLTWIRARAAWVHAIELRHLGAPAEVDALPLQAMGEPGRYAWAWEDEATGRLRSRYFATDVGILEDEATGAAAVVMGDRLGRPLTIRQGVGSELHVRPDRATGTVAVGGRTELVEVREVSG